MKPTTAIAATASIIINNNNETHIYDNIKVISEKSLGLTSYYFSLRSLRIAGTSNSILYACIKVLN